MMRTRGRMMRTMSQMMRAQASSLVQRPHSASRYAAEPL